MKGERRETQLTGARGRTSVKRDKAGLNEMDPETTHFHRDHRKRKKASDESVSSSNLPIYGKKF